MSLVTLKYDFLSQITAFYEDNYPEMMKNILVINGKFLHLSCCEFYVKQRFFIVLLFNYSTSLYTCQFLVENSIQEVKFSSLVNFVRLLIQIRKTTPGLCYTVSN